MSFMTALRRNTKFVALIFFILVLLAAQIPVQPAQAAPAAEEAQAPLSAPLATVSLGMPSNLMVGQDFSFTATFDNTDADEVGYGPFIDLVFPVTGADGAGVGVDDGINFVSATFLGASVVTQVNTFGTANTNGCSGGLGPVTHPYAITLTTGAPHIVCGVPGDKLVSILLPFGSFTPDQPAAVVTVNATLSDLADLNTPLSVRARGGYQYGATPTNDWCCGDATIVSHGNPSTAWPGSPVSPKLVTLTKTYNGPEDETATGPNYPRQYTLTVDIAEGQPVTGLTITDNLPVNMQFVSVDSTTPSASCMEPSTSTPGGTLTCTWGGTVTGGAGTSDATLIFSFFIPLNDSGALPVIDAISGDDVTSLNTSTTTGSWDPLDSRDPLTPFTEGGVCPTGCHTLTDKSIAIQKSVVNLIDTGASGYSPGDTLEYTLEIQVSDFFSFQDVVVTDVLSDGQRITGAPTLQVNGNNLDLSQANFNAANFTIDNSQIGNSGPNPPSDGTDGSQTIILRVSDEMVTRAISGKLIGGCVPVAGTGGSAPSCGAYNNGATTATITLRAVIQDEFTDTYPSGDESVDHGDHLDNAVSVVGDLLSVTNNATVTGQAEADTSGSSVTVAFGDLAKTVYAVNNVVCTPCVDEITNVGVNPGDTVTFRLRYTQPSSDFEATVLTDYLPLPLFYADDPDANGTAGPAWSQGGSIPPASGFWNYGPADTFHSKPGASAPGVASDAVNNTVAFSYPQYDDPTNSTSEIDLLFTVTVSDDPFADGLYLTNQANSSEGTTNSGDQVLDTILQIRINEPLLIPTKSAVSTDSAATGIAFTPAIGAPIVFDIPGTVDGTPDWSGGVINSQYLTSNSINANLNGIDGGDRIKFAIVIENRGGGVDGAFDIAIKDAKPAQLVIPASGLNLEVFLGDGTPISFADLGGGLFGSGIQLVDPGVPAAGACQAHHDTNGQNVIIITYDLQLDPAGVTSTNITNTTTLLSYSSAEGGPNFIPSGISDTATITPRVPVLGKTLKVTSEAHTLDTANPARVAIGEIARYRLTIRLPEGSFPNFQIRDQLPTGLTYLSDGTARAVLISNGTGFSSTGTGIVPAIPGGCMLSGNESTPIPDPLTCALADFNVGSTNLTSANDDDYSTGADVYFKFGNLVNGDEDDDFEVIVVEFNAQADNSLDGSNDAGDNRDNNFQLYANNATYGSASGSLRVRISEPMITDLDKSVLPTSGDAGDPVAYTLTFSNSTNTNATTAFNVNLLDTIPAKIALNLGSLGVVYTPAACSALTTNASAGNHIDLMFDVVPVGCRITVTYAGTLLSSVIPGEALLNTADLTYTSLPGGNGTVLNLTGSSTAGDAGTDDGERNGSGSYNDYFDSDTAQVDVTQIQPVKALISSTDPLTLDPNLTIGEVGRYRMEIRLSEGTSPAFQIRDNLPMGLQYLDDGATRLAFVSDAGDPTCAASSATIASSDAGLGSSPWMCGNETNLSTLTPAFVLPPASISGGPFAEGTDPTFSLSDLSNGDTDANAEYIVVEFNARLLNVAANQDSPATVRNNNFTVFIDSIDKGTSNDAPLTVVEPVLSLDKSLSSITGEVDAGGAANYTVVLTNTGTAPAYNSNFFDDLPVAVLDFNPASVNVVFAGGAGGLTDNSSDTLNRVDLLIDTIPVGGSVTITYNAVILVAVTPEQLVQNVGNVTWTSLSGTDSNERDSSGGFNDYSTSDTASFTIADVTFAKQLTMTSATHTTGSDVAIGEIVTYDILLTFPEGTTPSDTVTDDLPLGLAIVAGTPQVITSAAVSGGVLTADFNGTIGTQNITTDTSDGGIVQFDLTNIVTAADNVTTNNTIVLRFNAQVTDILDNQEGHVISNEAINLVGGSPETSNRVDVTVVEPLITFGKTVINPLPSPLDAGSVVQYQIVYSNGTGANVSTALDVNITDTFPTQLTLNLPVTVTLADGAAGITDVSTATGLDVTIASVPAGGSVTIDFSATVQASVTAGEIITNISYADWTSLEGDVTGERTGIGGVDDYITSDDASFTVDGVTVAKQLTTTSVSQTPGSGVAIGEEVTYDILLSFPEGVTPADTVTDDLPLGLAVVGGTAEVITNAAASGGVLAADFNGTLDAPTITADTSDGGSIQFDLTNIVTVGDNVTTNNTVLLRFRAQVTNILDNQAGHVISNEATNLVGGNTTTTPPVDVSVVEPVLTIQKSADDSVWVYGQTVTFTLLITHDVANSTSDAFEVVVSDTIPTGLTYAGGISAPAGWVADASTAPLLTWSCASADSCSIPLGGSASLSYQVTVNTPPGPPAPITGDATVTNTADMTWTSVPGDDNPGNTYGERTGSGGLNDYFTSDESTGGLEGYYALGNRVWFDTNNDSLINNGEVGVDGVQVDLYAAGDLTTVITSDITEHGGYYLFDFLAPGDYVVAVAASNFDDSAVLDTYWSSATGMDGFGVISEGLAANAELDATDSDDNGMLQTVAPLNGAVIAQAVTIGATEPIGEGDLETGVGQGEQPDDRANMTVDFGFYRTTIGNIVWLEDVAVDGAYAVGETLVDGASVRLYAADDTTEIPVGPDGKLNTSDDGTGHAATVGGLYAFSGLPEGSYIVKVVGPTGTVSTTDSADAADTAGPDVNTDHNDNGIGTVGNAVTSAVFIMDAGNVGAQSHNTVTNNDGTTANPTLDFGFAYPYSVGNRVWFDTNNDSLINFPDEVGVDDVLVELYAADIDGMPSGSALASDTTEHGGYYLFDNLYPGDYVVVIPASNFTGTGVLVGYWSSGTALDIDGTGDIMEYPAEMTENYIDSDDNGMRQPSGDVIASVVTLGPSGLVEPIDETDLETGVGQGLQPDGRANLTVDFGFYRVEVGNLVFGDLNKNGTFDAGDTRLDNIIVQILAADGTFEFSVGPDGMLGSTDDALGGMPTDANGQYLFSGLPEGRYIIRTTAPAGTSSTVDWFDQADNDAPVTNTDNNDNGDGIVGGPVSAEAIDLEAGSTGLQGKNTVTYDNGTTSNPTIDFGFSLAYALGNRVWFDTNNDSLINNGEVGVDEVLVQLYFASDLTTVIATDTTTNGGYYLFNNLDAGEYVVVIPSSNFDGGAVLEGYWSSGISLNGEGSLSELTAPDVDDSASDVDDNGMLQNSAPFSGSVTSKPISIGPGGIEPTGESDLDGSVGQGQPDAQANMTADFGFYTITLGNLVWGDANLLDNGLYESGSESGMIDVDIQLYASDGTHLVDTTTTDGSGLYNFSGLPEGSYIVRIPAAEFNPGGSLRDYISSTGGLATPYEPAPNPDTIPFDSDDNGTTTGGVPGLGGFVQTGIFELQAGAEESSDNLLGLTVETRVDFGVFYSQSTDLAVTKDDGTTFYLAGGSLTYTIVVTNNGPSDVPDALVSDALPSQISSWTWECDSETGGASGCDGATDLTADFTDTVDLPLGGTITYIVTATVSDTASGPLTNSVSVSSGGIPDIAPDNNNDEDVDQSASLQVTKDDGLVIVGVGSTLTYQIVITNNGAVDLTSLTVTDNLPAELTFVSATPAPTSVSGSLLTWTGLSLGSGASMTISVTADVSDDPANTTITNVVDVVDGDTGVEDSDDDVDSIATESDFSKALLDTNHAPTTTPLVAIGEILTYELTLSVPPGSMDNAKVVDTAQAGLAFVDCVSLSLPAGLTSTKLTDGVCNDGALPGSNPLVANAGATVTFDFGTLANTTAEPLNLVIRYSMIVLDITANQDGTTLTNSAEWTWTGGALDAPGPEVEIIEPDMYIEKSADTVQAPYGAAITFTLNVGHTPGSRTHAYDVVATDILPVGLSYLPGTLAVEGLAPTSSTYDPLTYTLKFTWDEFPQGQTSAVSFKATFVGPSPVTNAVSLAWTSLPIDYIGGRPVIQSVYNPNSTERWYDPLDSTDLNNYGAGDELTIAVPRLPETGFEAGVVTALPAQPDSLQYTDLGDFWIEIPQLGVKMPIVGVPLAGEGWDLTWLGQQAGWLEGTAYPTLAGNSVITAHVFDENGLPGPFVDLNKLYWGHKIIVHLGGQKYTYEVREVRIVWPQDRKVFQHEEYSWLTLITCKDYNEKTDTYAQRIAVRAVLLSVEADN